MGEVKSGKMKSWKTWLAIVLVILILAAVAVVAWVTLNSRNIYTVEATNPAPEASAALEASSAENSAVPNVAAAVAEAQKDPGLGKLSAHVTDAVTGQVLWEQNADQLLVPASSTKVITAAAALLAVDDDQRLSTKVVQEEPGKLVIVGGGDITLSHNGEGFFTDAASIADLAEQAQQKLQATPVTSIRVDNSIRQDSLFNGTWDKDDIAGGNVANLDSVMADAGRIEASESYSPRSTSPGQDVAAALAEKLGAGDVPITIDNAPARPDAEVLAEVHSAPLETRLRDMMVHSDNLLAEAVGREVAAARGLPTTFDGATQATIAALEEHGIDMTGAVLKDNSGMSVDNRLNARILDQILADPTFRPLLDDLPVSSVEGTLTSRYQPGSGAEAARGWVRAKTGTLDGVNALAGTVMTASGRPVTFALLSNGTGAEEARPALDRLATAIHRAA